MLNTVVSFVRVEADGIHTSDVQVDPGYGNNTTAPHVSSPGDDSVPLAGDTAAAVEVVGAGARAVVGYIDTKNEPKAQAGERRFYSRNADGDVVAEVWLKNTGEIVISNLQGDALTELVTITTGGIVQLASGTAPMPRADRVDTELQRIWQVLTTWTVVAQDGGAALQAAAIAASAGVASTASDKVTGE